MKFFFVLLPIIFLKCSPATNIVYLKDHKKTYEINISDVQFFLEEKDLPKEFDKVAILEAKNSDNTGNIFNDMKIESAEIGCNGIYMLKKENSGKTNINLGFYSIFHNGISIEESKDFTFIAIRFKVNGEYPKESTNKRIKNDSLYN